MLAKVVYPSQSRLAVQVTFPDHSVFEGPKGTPLEQFVLAAKEEQPDLRDKLILACVVDGSLRELTMPVERDVQVTPVTIKMSDGMRIYRRSLAFLLTVAVNELFPGVKVMIDYALPNGAYFCKISGRPPFDAEEVAAIKQRMREIVDAREPIERDQIPKEEARALFESCGDDDKVRLLEFRNKDYLTIYRLRDEVDYFYGYMVPNTGYLQRFEVQLEADGFTLVYPRREHPEQLQMLPQSPRLMDAFERREKWLQLLGVEDIGSLNIALRDGRALELILVAEALHEQHISQIAGQIAERHREGLRLVLIAGPSSSGKTTFSKRLAVQLMAHDLRPYTLEMDRYFVDRDLTPRDEHGEFDFEALAAVNLPLFNEQIDALTSGKAVRVPHFDFKSGLSTFEDYEVQLTPDQVLIVEGIHGLNPRLVESLPAERIFRVYVSALTQLNIDRHNRVPTTDMRLLRRIVRDAAHRGYSALDTLQRWDSVRRGEKRNIFPYQENADVMFNSALVYELGVLRPLAEPLLLQIEPRQMHYIEARRLLSILSWVMPLRETELIPANSLLREFVGDSVLRDYMPGLR